MKNDTDLTVVCGGSRITTKKIRYVTHRSFVRCYIKDVQLKTKFQPKYLLVKSSSETFNVKQCLRGLTNYIYRFFRGLFGF